MHRMYINKTKKPLPTSLKKIVRERAKKQNGYHKFVVGNKAIMVGDSRKGYIGNIYFNGEKFFFSQQLLKNIWSLSYHESLALFEMLSRFSSYCLGEFYAKSGKFANS